MTEIKNEALRRMGITERLPEWEDDFFYLLNLAQPQGEILVLSYDPDYAVKAATKHFGTVSRPTLVFRDDAPVRLEEPINWGSPAQYLDAVLVLEGDPAQNPMRMVDGGPAISLADQLILNSRTNIYKRGNGVTDKEDRATVFTVQSDLKPSWSPSAEEKQKIAEVLAPLKDGPWRPRYKKILRNGEIEYTLSRLWVDEDPRIRSVFRWHKKRLKMFLHKGEALEDLLECINEYTLSV